MEINSIKDAKEFLKKKGGGAAVDKTEPVSLVKDMVGLRRGRIKQDRMAEAVGISRSMLSRYESGRVDMGLSCAVRYLDLLGFELKIIKK